MTVPEICGACQRGISLEKKENNLRQLKLAMNFLLTIHASHCDYPKTGRRA